MPQPNKSPLSKGDIVHWNRHPPEGTTKSWRLSYGPGPFIVIRNRGLWITSRGTKNHLVDVARLSDAYLLPSTGNSGWWTEFFIKDEFLSAVKHAKQKGKGT